MFALVKITPWHWSGFVVCVVVFLVVDLRLFHRQAHVIKVREALLWSAVWFSLAMLFALLLRPMRGEKESLQFLTGYLIELSLSMDNVFIIALLFAYFRIPSEHQHRVLFWGILGALIMRGMMIGVGVALINLLDWIFYLFGALLLYSGVKMMFVDSEMHPEKSRVLRVARMLYPVAPHLDGQKFFTVWEGRKALTPLALVLVLVETTDLFFAVDSIPAVFAVTTKPFIVFTSNVFAILGLRSLYFLLAGALRYFRFLKPGLALVLVFIGVKMLLDPHDNPHPRWFQIDLPISISLLVVAGIIFLSMVLSLISAGRQGKAPAGNPAPSASPPEGLDTSGQPGKIDSPPTPR